MMTAVLALSYARVAAGPPRALGPWTCIRQSQRAPDAISRLNRPSHFPDAKGAVLPSSRRRFPSRVYSRPQSRPFQNDSLTRMASLHRSPMTKTRFPLGTHAVVLHNMPCGSSFRSRNRQSLVRQRHHLAIGGSPGPDSPAPSAIILPPNPDVMHRRIPRQGNQDRVQSHFALAGRSLTWCTIPLKHFLRL